jgi:hypothetical protein
MIDLALSFFIFERGLGFLLGLVTLHLHDEGRWNDALLKGSMKPPASPEERLRFMMMCVIVPEIPMAGFLWAWLHRKDP